MIPWDDFQPICQALPRCEIFGESNKGELLKSRQGHFQGFCLISPEDLFSAGVKKIMVLCGTYQNHQPFVQHLSDLAIDIQQVYQKPGGLLFGVCRFAYKLCSIHMLLWGWAISHLCPDSGL